MALIVVLRFFQGLVGVIEIGAGILLIAIQEEFVEF
jgi:hypothetical protein